MTLRLRFAFLKKSAIPASLVLVCLPLIHAAERHIVIMKDGFTLSGTIKQDTERVIEGDLFMNIPKLGGFFWVDDGARRIVFGHKQAQEAERAEADPDADLRFTTSVTNLDHFKLPAGRPQMPPPFDAKWNRTMTLKVADGRVRIPQRLTLLTPHYARVESKQYNWNPHYLTSEFDPPTVRTLLGNHPDLKPNGKGDDKKRFRIYQFLVHAGMYEQARAELDSILADMPDQKERAEKSRDELTRMLGVKYVDMVEQGQKMGRHEWALGKARAFSEKGMDEKLVARIRAIRTNLENADNSVAMARDLLQELPQNVVDTDHRQFFSRAAEAIIAELTPDNTDRLEEFVNTARKSKDRAAHTPEQLLSLAISGWLLGNTSADSKVDRAIRLWESREMVLTYQRTHHAAERQRMLTLYQASGPLAFDEMAELIRHLPPPEPFEYSKKDGALVVLGALPYSPAPVAWMLYSVQKLLLRQPDVFQVDLPWNYRKGSSYHVWLPPEYHHGRQYPVLITLYDVGEKPDWMIQRWSTLSDQNGYILVVPHWDKGTRRQYTYSADEHATVVDALRDVRRRFSIDPDRVFLAGFGEGANMAFDVGLAHPDLFAGVLPMSGQPQYFAKKYWPNAFALPFYVVAGDLDGDAAKASRQQFESWVPKGYPGLYIEYKGRGRDWFAEELPYMFDWMNRKHRASGYPELGRIGVGAQSMRPDDNHFYWLSGDGMLDRNINNARDWSFKVGAAGLYGRGGGNNIIRLGTHGFRRVTVWFGPGMIDFEKPVTLYVNDHLQKANRMIKPDLETLLEDFYLRGDRQQLIYAKWEISL
jgi:predicted esterase